jgi:FMNH2-dependent dimethyl sulfone monooxygenase
MERFYQRPCQSRTDRGVRQGGHARRRRHRPPSRASCHIPPIYAASRSPQGKALIAQHGDVWFAEYKPGYRNFESNIERMAADMREMDRPRGEIWRKLRYAINPQVICCDTQGEAERLADEAERHAGPRDRMVNALGAGLVGTPQLIAERLRRYEQAASIP